MKSILEIISLIEQRPAMYIGRNYISCLDAFLTGYTLSNSKQVVDIHLLTEFQDFIEKKYRINTTHSWASILLFNSTDECEALKLFFEEFNEFVRSRQS